MEISASDGWSLPHVEIGPKHGDQLPSGLRYAANFISEAEEQEVALHEVSVELCLACFLSVKCFLNSKSSLNNLDSQESDQWGNLKNSSNKTILMANRQPFYLK